MAICRVTGGVHSSQLSKLVSKKQLKSFNHWSPIVQNPQFSQRALKVSFKLSWRFNGNMAAETNIQPH